MPFPGRARAQVIERVSLHRAKPRSVIVRCDDPGCTETLVFDGTLKPDSIVSRAGYLYRWSMDNGKHLCHIHGWVHCEDCQISIGHHRAKMHFESRSHLTLVGCSERARDGLAPIHPTVLPFMESNILQHSGLWLCARNTRELRELRIDSWDLLHIELLEFTAVDNLEDMRDDSIGASTVEAVRRVVAEGVPWIVAWAAVRGHDIPTDNISHTLYPWIDPPEPPELPDWGYDEESDEGWT